MVSPRCELSLHKYEIKMKIVQSFWSKPLLEHKADNGCLGGWCTDSFFYMSIALSCLTLRNFYDQVELYTDEVGYDLLIKKLKLPYTKVHVVLDRINNYPKELWAIGKIITYGLQDQSFIHVDNDVFLWKKFPKRIEKAQLIGQHEEINYGFNKNVIDDVKQKAIYLPHEISDLDGFYNETNAGIIGGNDYVFFHDFSRKAIDFIDRNRNAIGSFHIPETFNTVFEQYLFSCMCKTYKRNVEFLFHNIDDQFRELGEVELIPNKQYYVHALAFYKKDFHIGEFIAYHLWRYYPKYYDLILKSDL